MHLAELLSATAARTPERVAFLVDGTPHTYAEVDRTVDLLTAELRDRGLEKGDRLVVLAGTGLPFVLAVFAGLRAGAVVVPINSRSAAGEIEYFCVDSGARLLLFDPEHAEVVGSWAGRADRQAETTPLCLGATQGVEDLLAAAQAHADTRVTSHEAPVQIAEDDDALIIYTSGTTGRPKGALFDHHRVLWVGVGAITSMGLHDGERMLIATPMYHSATLNLLVFPSVLLGGTAVVHAAFDPEAVLDAMESERITFFFGVPTMFQLMLRSPGLAGRDLSSLRTAMYGAAPMPASAATALVEAMPHTRLVQLCGQTEGGPNGIMLTHEEILANPSASGRFPVALTQVRVVDPNGADVAPGEVGELLTRGETVMKGYWGKPEETAATIRDGWLHTGDLARVDEEGYITLVDRLKDLIITGGRNVYSAEVESALAGCPGVADIAVIGRPHLDYGESVVAVVTPVEGADVTLETLRAYGADRIADFKLPRELILTTIPRNASGKILKHRLRSDLDSTQETS